ncbi:DUF317 domain-containing protein [Streptomyces leeuwenhoekii]|uniref:DUF317 domain-containing protein n=1 Tax=Streptomyces leeuwenhoekii TaxID=1437453 RepID=A0A0F7VSQ1_STRLW|nr:DUF317 domain-containing protein [Streptomyces leeuwenhoekii]CQR62770.1 Conserved Hypothetical Protein [Streptomyces leeuwenhoekii]
MGQPGHLPPEAAAKPARHPIQLHAPLAAPAPSPPNPLEAHLHPDFPTDPPAPACVPSAYWVGPRHLAGDDGRLYDSVADVLAGLGWTSLTLVRGRKEPDEAPEDRQVLRSTVLHISPDSLRWAQWVLPDEPFHLGNLPIAWQVSARTDRSSPLAQWSAYFTPGVPGEVLADFVAALDVRDQPALPCGGHELVLDAVTAHGWLRDVDQPGTGATDPTFASHIRLGEVPPLIQDGNPLALVAGADEAAPAGWQAWAEPVLGAGYLWGASFGASVPHDLVAAFAGSLSSSAPVLRRVLPESTRDRLLRAPAI